MEFNTREEMLTLLPKGTVCAEIGVFEGEYSQLILDTILPKELYLVDLFEGVVGSGDKNGQHMKYLNLNDEYTRLTTKYKNNPGVKVLKEFSTVFLSSLPDNHLDFVYIDAEHTYESVSKELAIAEKKVKKEGYICGHDYCDRTPGVKQAVDSFCQSNNYTLFLTKTDLFKSFLIKR